jgi:hypothetical protein
MRACALTVRTILGTRQPRRAPSADKVQNDDESIVQRVLSVVDDVDASVMTIFMNDCRDKLCHQEHRWYVRTSRILSLEFLLLGKRSLEY